MGFVGSPPPPDTEALCQPPPPFAQSLAPKSTAPQASNTIVPPVTRELQWKGQAWVFVTPPSGGLIGDRSSRALGGPLRVLEGKGGRGGTSVVEVVGTRLRMLAILLQQHATFWSLCLAQHFLQRLAVPLQMC